MAKLEMSCGTDVGAVRKSNQDSVAVFPQHALVVLADGMGGHNAGEVASRKAVEVIRDAVRDGVGLESAVIRANAEVYRMSEVKQDYSGMGTTLVAAKYEDDKVIFANVGDSRMYRFRKQKFEQLTADQTVAQEMRNHDIEYNEGRHISAFEHILTNALGIQSECEVVMSYEVVEPGDIYLFCSDGLSGVLDDELIAKILKARAGTIEGVIQNLLSAALRRSAADNISIALVESVRPARKALNLKFG